MNERDKANAALDALFQQRLDPQEFVRALDRQMYQAALSSFGRLLGETVRDWVIEADRERLIDAVRD